MRAWVSLYLCALFLSRRQKLKGRQAGSVPLGWKLLRVNKKAVTVTAREETVMKKAIIYGMSLALILSMTACGGSNENAADKSQETSTPKSPSPWRAVPPPQSRQPRLHPKPPPPRRAFPLLPEMIPRNRSSFSPIAARPCMQPPQSMCVIHIAPLAISWVA